MPRRLLVINGPNLNLLGRREPGVDGRTTLADITAGALTHTRVAVRDALVRVAIPFVEVHISNVCRRKAFRHHSYLSDVAVGLVVGWGVRGHRAALEFARDYSARP